MVTFTPLHEIADVCAALSNQISAGIPLAESLKLLAQLQPHRAEQWNLIARDVAQGGRLSKSLVDVWPENFVSSIRAGEESGKLSAVCSQIEDAIEVRRTSFSILGQLLYPVMIIGAGICTSFFFLVFVIPTLVKSILGQSQYQPSAILSIGISLNTHIFAHLIFYLIIFCAGLAAMAYWVISGRAFQHAQTVLLKTPGIAPQATTIFYALWARTLGIMTGAGIPVMQAISMSIMSLPSPLRDSAQAVYDALDHSQSLGMSAHATSSIDERNKLHFYIVSAFKVAEQTGLLHVELNRVAPIMIRDATRKIRKIASICMIVAMTVAAILLVLPMGIYYRELFSLIGKM